MPTPIDHLVVLAFAVVWPAWGTFVEMPRFKRDLAAGVPGILVRGYRETIARQWLLTAAALVAWMVAARAWSTLGVAWPHGLAGAIAAGVTVLAIAFQWVQLGSVSRSPATREAIRAQLAPLAFFLPRRPEEIRGFLPLALTAGICEEVLFRGFLIWYLAAYVGTWPAVAISTLVFALAHVYQGFGGTLKAGAAGAVMAVLYVTTGSLLLPVILHAATDVLGGLTAYEGLKEEAPAEPLAA